MELMIGLVTVALLALVLYTVFTTPASTGCLSEDARRAKAAAEAVAQRKAEAAAAKTATVSPAPAKEAAKASSAPVSAPAAKVEAEPAKPAAAPAEKAAAAPAAKPAAAPKAAAPAPAPAPAAAPAAADVTLRDPATGEKATVPANYRFAKKWIKEALVKEGLLDKVYKNNELDAEASKKVKAALEQFKTLAKYHA